MSDFDAKLERAQADGRLSIEDADTIRDFAAFLTDSTSRCAICLTDDQEGATWKRHHRHPERRIFICRTCQPPTPSNESRESE